MPLKLGSSKIWLYTDHFTYSKNIIIVKAVQSVRVGETVMAATNWSDAEGLHLIELWGKITSSSSLKGQRETSMCMRR